ncbi:hypothetical protein [Alteribacillus bidgolensis]|uniref:Uncharacterized protein n=1 Tax=Alteribacillus bidgolensis TaxID=930129 RepID=A0A1G8J4B4_9BACI|nr:hypothetical protein [Alteribacillus bidgolensis]SDI26138.1 hypothetical protein SAMN05216352_10639 [Alteribacillus bidgolensis]
MNLRTVYMRTLLFCVILILAFAVLHYIFKIGEGASVLLSLAAAFLGEWFYKSKS